MAEEGSDKIGTLWMALAGISSFTGVAISLVAMWQHLHNYRRPPAQRNTLRILLMVPVYAISSFVALYSRHGAFYIDLARDVYEAFVIYTFFVLLINYMGGERHALVLLEASMRPRHMWPFNLWFGPLDISDPDVFLIIRRGILQFVIVKPLMSLLILILKISGNYHEGYISKDSAYLWLSLLYNITMYCLVMFYLQSSHELKAYRPLPKFLCVKAIIFFSFWQGLTISFLVAFNIIKGDGQYSANNMAEALQNLLICLEMVPFSLAHWHAFSWRDYDSSRLSSRVVFRHALKDALGFQDIIIDARHTFQGTMFKDVGADAGQLLERDDEDNEANFVLGGQRRFYDQRRPRRQGGGKRSSRRMHRGYGAIPIDDGQGGSGGGVGSSSDAGEHGGYGYEVDEEEPLEFPDELDADVESEYLQSRELVFGDMNFPVVHEDPRFREPPQIQQEILKKASTFSFDRLPALAGGGDGVGASSSFSAATAAINIFPSHAPSSTLNPVPTHSSSFGSSSTSSISSHRQLRQPTTYGSGSSTKVLFNPESFKSSKH